MKRVGIATITYTRDENIDFNYGNVLQNYALTRFLQKNDLKVETIYYHTNHYLSRKQNQGIEKRSMPQLIDDIQRVAKRNIFSKQLAKKRANRRQAFNQFLAKHIRYSQNEYYYDSNLEELDSMYDFLITGSDQVWNPYYEGSNEFYYLGFGSQGKRIAYAPSIAVDTIPDEIKEEYLKWIGHIDFLSIREEAGRTLLKKYGYDPTLVCDPVFLLSKEEWREIAPKKHREKYFLVYILGKKTVEIKKAIKRIEKKLGIKAIDIYNRDDINSVFAGPDEFVSYIDGAEFVLTNSFHGVAFSIIMGTPLVLVERDSGINMNSRIESILRIVGIEAESISSHLNKQGMPNCVYNYEKLEALIQLSKQFLLDACS